MVGSGTPAVTAAIPKPCRKAFGQACGPMDAGAGHESSRSSGARLPATTARAAALPDAFAGVANEARARAREPGSRLAGIGASRQRLGAALERPEPDRGRFKIDVHGPHGQGFRHPCTGKSQDEGEGLVRGVRPPGQPTSRKRPTLFGGEILAAAPVDQAPGRGSDVTLLMLHSIVFA